MDGKWLIAVADDDGCLRESIRNCLSDLGHEPRTAEDGNRLIELYRAEAPDLAVSDRHMPGLDGLSAAAVIRREIGVPIVLVSGGRTDLLRECAVPPGAICLNKPLSPPDLASAMVRAKTDPAGGSNRPGSRPHANGSNRQEEGLRRTQARNQLEEERT